MLAPWECIDAVADALAPGGVVLCYIATATQLSVSRSTSAPRVCSPSRSDRDDGARLARRGPRGAPDHRMVAHTGFLITARRLAPGAMPPDVKRRAAKKPSYGDEDVELWTPGAVGDREITDKNLRKRVREAQRAAGGARWRRRRRGRKEPEGADPSA
jgi:tRNA (adenine57-N1/adenine58-N1)-methyltransferase